MTQAEEIKELKAALKQVMDDCERGMEAFGIQGPLGMKTIALIKELLA